jgi:GPH family glycoside/pentoside/hexuronide:cation symporter
MLPDVVDLDEVRTGKRREGDLYSIFLLFQKVGLGTALAFSGYTLGWVGYINPTNEQDDDPNFEQPSGVVLVLRLMVTLIPAGLLLLSFVAVYFYPIDKQRHKEILEEISAVKSIVL